MKDAKKRRMLENVFKMKRWNPYCIRQSQLPMTQTASRICFEKEGELDHELEAASKGISSGARKQPEISDSGSRSIDIGEDGALIIKLLLPYLNILSP
jgi:hypothetical protein